MGFDRQPPAHGAMTGASGDLTPPEDDEALVTGERRVMEDDQQQVAVTSAMHREAETHRARTDRPGEGEASNPNQRDGGYGSEHGLSHDDPAYDMEEASPRRRSTPPSEIGSDVRLDPERDHM